jgi:hypothetical protein
VPAQARGIRQIPIVPLSEVFPVLSSEHPRG